MHKDGFLRRHLGNAWNRISGVFGYGMTEAEFNAARARTRQAIEMFDVAIQGAGPLTVAFDVGGAMATQIDIFEANVPLLSKIHATAWNGVGILGIIGAIPTPKTVAAGFAIDSYVFFKVNGILEP